MKDLIKCRIIEFRDIKNYNVVILRVTKQYLEPLNKLCLLKGLSIEVIEDN